MISIIIFAVLLLLGFGFFAMNVNKIRTNILMGRDVDRSDNKGERLKVMSLIALGQKKMFKKPIPAILHLCLYVAFVVTQIELLEIIADGLTGEHRVFREALGGFYTFIISFIEVLSVLAFVATFIFLARRNLLKIPRFNMKEMKGWPKIDGNMILVMELILVTFIFMMNGADEVLYSQGLSHAENLGDQSFGFAISQFVGPALFGGMSESSLIIVERIGWWGHILMVFTFLNYLPFSKHFHIILAFPNTYFSNLKPQGQFNNMEAVMKEVKLMMDPDADPYAVPEEGDEDAVVQRFGAKDVEDLTWKNLLDSYTCTECGRCTSSCPANQTGKLLSPRKIMMDTRDRLEEKGEGLRKNGKDYDDGKSLLNDYITEEELWACTSCNACVESCPVNIDPLSIIMDMRRYLVMEESKVPNELAGMISNIENNGAPWQFSPEDRLNWREEK
ncbi:(Fe-S)-binding protein [Brumimicrobium mesophilum]|uniref:(Fe-S)-binding protein n=1 Tax=Brumimicrobium mesophilum TaxID=392717 RepID=UPI000D14369C|nr:(Fe-S)-binding protein [Brumimicrobium mesophilum]